MGQKYGLRSIFDPCWTQILRLFPYWGVVVVVVVVVYITTTTTTATTTSTTTAT